MRTLISLLALTLCAACASHLPATVPMDQFGALRFSGRPADQHRFAALVSDADALDAEYALPKALGTPLAGQPSRCDADSIARSERKPWVRLAAAEPDEVTWRADVSVIQAGLTEVASLEAAYIEGRAYTGPLHIDEKWALPSYQRARADTSDPRLRELYRRAILEQTPRVLTMPDVATPLTASLSPRALELWPYLVMYRTGDTDCGDTSWLRAQVAANGWFDIHRYGEFADGAAWLMVQHADNTPAFQGEMLTRLQALAADGGTSAINVAYLWDRVAVKEGRPQRYGTQMDCEGGAQVPIGALEDPEHIEQRRAAAHMQGYAEYVAMMQSASPCPH